MIPIDQRSTTGPNITVHKVRLFKLAANRTSATIFQVECTTPRKISNPTTQRIEIPRPIFRQPLIAHLEHPLRWLAFEQVDRRGIEFVDYYAVVRLHITSHPIYRADDAPRSTLGLIVPIERDESIRGLHYSDWKRTEAGDLNLPCRKVQHDV